MLQTLKKHSLAATVIGALLIIAGVLFVFVFEEIGESIRDVAIGAMIILIVIFLIFPDLKKKQSKLVFNLLILEIVIGIFVAAMFIFGSGGQPSLWIGLMIYIHGLVELIGGYFSTKKHIFSRFIIAIVLVSFGVYIYAANLITNDMLMWVLLFLFLIPGVFMLTIGLLGLSKKPKKKKA